MRMRIAAVGVVFVVTLLAFIGAPDTATAIGRILVLGSFAIFAWAVVGGISPRMARLPARNDAAGLWVVSVVMFIIGAVVMPDQPPTAEDLAEQQREAERLTQQLEEQAAREAAEQAEREAEDRRQARAEQEQSDITGSEIAAAVMCPEHVERLARYGSRWVDGWLETKFRRVRWIDREKGTVTWIGDRVEFQNGFGAWMPHVYECDIDARSRTVLAVRAEAGRLQ